MNAPWALTCAGRAGGGTAKHQALRLGQRDVAAIREGRDAQAAAVADVLVVVRDLSVANVDLLRQRAYTANS